MPETFKVTVCGDAQTGVVNTSPVTAPTSNVFIFFITVPFWIEI
jgi:hypothetical protein